jgi:hypothetical protein
MGGSDFGLFKLLSNTYLKGPIKSMEQPVMLLMPWAKILTSYQYIKNWNAGNFMKEDRKCSYPWTN